MVFQITNVNNRPVRDPRGKLYGMDIDFLVSSHHFRWTQAQNEIYMLFVLGHPQPTPSSIHELMIALDLDGYEDMFNVVGESVHDIIMGKVMRKIGRTKLNLAKMASAGHTLPTGTWAEVMSLANGEFAGQQDHGAQEMQAGGQQATLWSDRLRPRAPRGINAFAARVPQYPVDVYRGAACEDGPDEDFAREKTNRRRSFVSGRAADLLDTGNRAAIVDFLGKDESRRLFDSLEALQEKISGLDINN